MVIVHILCFYHFFPFFFSSRRRHTRFSRDWSSDVCSSDLQEDADHVGQHQRSEHRYDPVHIVKLGLDAPGPLKGEGDQQPFGQRSEERRVGKEWRGRWTAYHEKKKEY